MFDLPGMVFPDESLAGRVKQLALRFEQIGELDKTWTPQPSSKNSGT
jgi:hypothetical protein